MILATYQPYIKNENKNKSVLELENFLGFEPIFCFPANSAKEALLYSFLVDTNIPEKIVFFEAKKAIDIDIVQWTRKVAQEMRTLSNPKDYVSVGDCFTEKPKKYKEYIVEHVDNIIEEVDVKQAFFDNYFPTDNDTSPAAQLLLGLAAQAKESAEYLCKDFKVPLDQNRAWPKYSEEQKYLLKEIFQCTFLPLLYPAIMDEDFWDSASFNLIKYTKNGVAESVNLFHSAKESMKWKTYEFYDSVYAQLESCLKETHFSELTNDEQQPRQSEKINPNAPCPCGSGKKYKKCCRNKNIS